MKEKTMEIVYRVHNGLYVNLTNRCSSSCTFCLREMMDRVGESEPLWLEHEPDFEEVKEAFAPWDLSRYDEIVFCGFGEPTCALPVLLQTASWLKSICDLPLRLNTNGQGNLINDRDISDDLAELFDAVSVSLNHPDPGQYQAIVQSRFGEEAYPSMLCFAKDCVKKGLDVTFTTVDTTITKEEEQRCREIAAEVGANYRIRTWAKN